MDEKVLVKQELKAIIQGLETLGYQVLLRPKSLLVCGGSEIYTLRRSSMTRAWSITPSPYTIEFKTIFRRICWALFYVRWKT